MATLFKKAIYKALEAQRVGILVASDGPHELSLADILWVLLTALDGCLGFRPIGSAYR